MKLFEPNNLSRPSPEFTPVTDPRIVALLEEHYGLSQLIQISAFVGANVSASNFKIETPAGKYFLQSRGAEAELTFALSELGQKVPRIIRTREGGFVSSVAEKCWVLYEFQEGDYFSGKGDELLAAGEAFGELTRAAESLFSATEVVAVPTGLAELVDRSDIDVVHRPIIMESLSEVDKHRKLLNGRVLPIHLDYHPLNLLMRGDCVACIVDLEHLRPYSVVSGVGFAGFKLIRQAMVDVEFRERELREHGAVSTWLRGWQKSFPDDRFTASELGIGVRARILTLIQMILDASLNREDHRSLYDLEKQIVSLYEADVIFGPSRD